MASTRVHDARACVRARASVCVRAWAYMCEGVCAPVQCARMFAYACMCLVCACVLMLTHARAFVRMRACECGQISMSKFYEHL